MAIPLISSIYTATWQAKQQQLWELKIRRYKGEAKQTQPRKYRRPRKVNLSEKYAIAYLIIPRIKLKTVVVEGTSYWMLAKGPGLMPGTGPLGSSKNSLVAGHRTMHGAPFKYIDRLRKGDLIEVYTDQAYLKYRVIDKKVVLPRDFSEIKKGSYRLILSTCEPMFSARRRLLIMAELEKREGDELWKSRK
jgi:LPXTG-site transpeptidase (sortase) family protein